MYFYVFVLVFSFHFIFPSSSTFCSYPLLTFPLLRFLFYVSSVTFSLLRFLCFVSFLYVLICLSSYTNDVCSVHKIHIIR